jgi:hypothetical protein
MNPKNFNDDNRIEKWEDALKLYDSFVTIRKTMDFSWSTGRELQTGNEP